MPRAMPPTRVIGIDWRLPNAAAAIAAMSRKRKFSLLTWENSGASRTPARPANRLESIQATVLMRSALMPASSVMRGLSTVARIRRPSWDQRKRAVSAPTATRVTMIVASWLPSMA